MTMKRGTGILIVLLLTSSTLAEEASDLLPPVQMQAAGKALDIEREGHAAPFVGDFYGDGGLCLLVGQFDDGRLRIYRNSGTHTRPRFESYVWFKAGGKIASVPAG
jgi:hypothetical protein